MFKSTLGLALGLAVLLTAAQSGTDPGIPLVFKGVKIRFNRSATDRRLVDKTVELIFDDTGRQISVKSSERPVTIAYDDVRKVVFDVTTHMRGGALGEIIGGIPGAILEAKHVNDYWFYVEQTSGLFAVLEIPKDSSAQVIDKAKALFGDRVSEYPTQQGEKIEKETLKDLQSKHSLNADKKQHPTPELKPDKALVVVVCPPLAARYSGKGNQYKLHANDKVVAVNKMGTYSFAYLDPGEYVLASQSENASALKMNLEAGKDYYFLQNTFMGAWKARTSLSLQSKEIVLHEMSGAKYADWKQK
jgi:hypothetical protein